jgi:hypothetical protein
LRGERYLIISDLQIPFEAHQALPFCREVQKTLKIPAANVLCVGDETDGYHGGDWPKDPDAHLSAVDELREAKERLKDWYRAFPRMKLAVSNHMLRWSRKAFNAQIPSQILKPWADIIEAPATWIWKERWDIPTRHPFSIIHGMGYSGMNGHRQAALTLGRSVAIGHLHSHGGIAQVRTETQTLWGMNVGCLIDVDAFAFKYGKYSKDKPTLGVGAVVDDGRMPLWFPYEGKKR